MPRVLMKHCMRLSLLAAVAVAFSCAAPRADSPELAYLAFANAARRGEIKVAASYLSSRTQAALEARLKALALALPDAGIKEEAFLALSSGVKAQPVAGLRVVRQDATQAVLAVTVGERTENPAEQAVVEVTMVKEGSRWLLEVPALLDGGTP